MSINFIINFRKVSERQATELSHASFLQLNINTNDGVETLNIAFDTPERKNEWEEAFIKAKEKLGRVYKLILCMKTFPGFLARWLIDINS